MRELHVETSARGGDRIQRRLIVQHLGHRHLRFDDLVLAARIHALYAAAPRIEIAHDIAAAFLGRVDLDVHDWLEQRRLHLFHRGAKRFAARGAEAVLV